MTTEINWEVSSGFDTAGDPATRHDVWITEKRLTCDRRCPGQEPHLNEYRASDVNPNR